MKSFNHLILTTLLLCGAYSGVFAQFTQQGGILVGTGAVGKAMQGSSVSLSADGNTAIIGGPNDDDPGAQYLTVGAAWVWTRNNGTWNQQGSKLVGTSDGSNFVQGSSVSVSSDGNTALVGGPQGTAWIWSRLGTAWTQQGSYLQGTGAVVQGYTGVSVSLSSDGNTAIVGGSIDSAVWVWTRSAGVWTRQGGKYVGTGGVGYASQGVSVSLSADGNTAIVGGSGDNKGAGAVWVWTRSAGVWTQQGGKLVGSGAVGSASQGVSVSLSADGNTAIVGGSDDNNGAGAVWVWTRSAGVWTQQGGKLVGSGAVGKSKQGFSVSLSSNGNTAIVGGPEDTVISGGPQGIGQAGAAWVWTRTNGVWSQLGSKLVGTQNTSGSGYYALQGSSVSLSADGNTAIVGGPANNTNTGAAWVFTRNGTPVLPEGFNRKRLHLKNGNLLKYYLPKNSVVNFRILDAKGVLQKTLVNGFQKSGPQEIYLPKEFLKGGYLLDFIADGYHKVLPIQGR